MPAVIVQTIFRRVLECQNLGAARKVHIVAQTVAAGVAVDQRTVNGDFAAAVVSNIDTAAGILTLVSGDLAARKAQFSIVAGCPDSAAFTAAVSVAGNGTAGHNERRGMVSIAAVDIHRAAGTGIALNDTAVHGEAGTLRRSVVVYTHRAGTIP